MPRPILEIVLDPQKSLIIRIPPNPNSEAVDLAWACLRYLRTREPLGFHSRAELAGVAKTEREYTRERAARYR
jgi:hypothetical protein